MGRMRQFSAWIGCIEFNLRKVPSGSQTPKIRSLRQPARPLGSETISRGGGSERSPVFGVDEKAKVLDIFCSD
jgi:hypothetical protein